jgi:hypothetical protein
MDRDIMLGDVSMFVPQSGGKCVFCEVWRRNYVL